MAGNTNPNQLSSVENFIADFSSLSARAEFAVKLENGIFLLQKTRWDLSADLSKEVLSKVSGYNAIIHKIIISNLETGNVLDASLSAVALSFIDTANGLDILRQFKSVFASVTNWVRSGTTTTNLLSELTAWQINTEYSTSGGWISLVPVSGALNAVNSGLSSGLSDNVDVFIFGTLIPE